MAIWHRHDQFVSNSSRRDPIRHLPRSRSSQLRSTWPKKSSPRKPKTWQWTCGRLAQWFARPRRTCLTLPVWRDASNAGREERWSWMRLSFVALLLQRKERSPRSRQAATSHQWHHSPELSKIILLNSAYRNGTNKSRQNRSFLPSHEKVNQIHWLNDKICKSQQARRIEGHLARSFQDSPAGVNTLHLHRTRLPLSCPRSTVVSQHVEFTIHDEGMNRCLLPICKKYIGHH